MRRRRSPQRRRCEEAVRGLTIPVPFDLAAFCDRLARHRNRPIRLLPATLPAGSPCGLWIATDTADYITYERDTAGPHREHIILHEVGHMVLDHAGTKVTVEDSLRLLLPNLDPRMVRSVLGRSGYSAEEEQEAELFAALVQERGGQASLSRQHASPADTAFLRRLACTLEEPGRGGPGV
jgi:hypothetical protein